MTVPAAVVRSVVCFVHVSTRGALEYKTEKVHEVIPDLVEAIDANERIELDGERLRACHLFLLVDPEAVLDYTACYSVILSVPLLYLSLSRAKSMMKFLKSFTTYQALLRFAKHTNLICIIIGSQLRSLKKALCG